MINLGTKTMDETDEQLATRVAERWRLNNPSLFETVIWCAAEAGVQSLRCERVGMLRLAFFTDGPLYAERLRQALADRLSAGYEFSVSC